MPAFYSNSINSFLVEDTDTIIGKLSTQLSVAGYHHQLSSQTAAWKEQIRILKSAIPTLTGFILLEYPIPRRAKRIDTVLLVNGHVLILEFKIGANRYNKDDINQLEDYCLDLRDFHKSSYDAFIIPVLVPSSSPKRLTNIPNPLIDKVLPIQFADGASLKQTVQCLIENLPNNKSNIRLDDWNNSPYEPTPTIIESAQQLYAKQSVKEITRTHAGVTNLSRTSEFIVSAIEAARKINEKLIIFLTGVPGAGKTLAGLNIVHSHELHKGELGVFLSGNGPLVKVLTEALARDYSKRNKSPLTESRRKVTTFIQNVHHFLDEYYPDKSKTPIDQIIVFDEAQRAWNRKQSFRKFKRDFSEPEMLLEIMNRHKEWAVIVALIGGGQEINTGEAGLPEWGRSLKQRFSNWKILISPELKEGHHSTGGQCLFTEVPKELSITEENSLHLKISTRSYKAEKLTEFIECILSRNSNNASRIIYDLKSSFPIFLTRSIDEARHWLKSKQRGSRRIGLIGSSGARRLKAYGLDVKSQLDVATWFLNPPNDVRSSCFLEEIATEFAVQGLELDWTCVCWGMDLYVEGNQWKYRTFKGTKWQKVNSEENQQYIINKYRVLLTRAREGMIICVPFGSEEDDTRKPKYYDNITSFLLECGVPLL